MPRPKSPEPGGVETWFMRLMQNIGKETHSTARTFADREGRLNSQFEKTEAAIVNYPKEESPLG